MTNFIALIDCDNFYASCERVFDPSLKNRPVVRAFLNHSSCFVTHSALEKFSKDGSVNLHVASQNEPLSFSIETKPRHGGREKNLKNRHVTTDRNKNTVFAEQDTRMTDILNW